MFKRELPKLQDGENGKLKITANKIDIVSERIAMPPTFAAIPAPNPLSAHAPLSTHIPLSALPQVNHLSGLDRIAEL